MVDSSSATASPGSWSALAYEKDNTTHLTVDSAPAYVWGSSPISPPPLFVTLQTPLVGIPAGGALIPEDKIILSQLASHKYNRTELFMDALGRHQRELCPVRCSEYTEGTDHGTVSAAIGSLEQVTVGIGRLGPDNPFCCFTR